MKTPAEQFCDCIGINAGDLMDRSKTYFQRNTTPCDVYTITQLEEWYRIHSKLKDKNGLLLSQARELEPEDVFCFEDLKKWANENGFEQQYRACNCETDTCTACLDVEEDHEG